jgi:hypothetical protein
MFDVTDSPLNCLSKVLYVFMSLLQLHNGFTRFSIKYDIHLKHSSFPSSVYYKLMPSSLVHAKSLQYTFALSMCIIQSPSVMFPYSNRYTHNLQL